MGNLTLEQVREAGREATNDTGRVTLTWKPPWRNFPEMMSSEFASIDRSHWYRYGHGWHHLPGCTCEHCR